VKREAEDATQVAAPTESRNTQLAPSKKSLTRECGWKGGDRGGLAERKKMEKIMEKAKNY
jgi:hypothetical protein